MSPDIDERAAAVAWLRRRAAMCGDGKQELPWWRPIERVRLGAMAGTFSAAATLIELGAHHQTTLEGETAIIRKARGETA